MADGRGAYSKIKKLSTSSSHSSNHRHESETPYQDFKRIKRTILAIRETKGGLSSEDYFKDPFFTADITSLSYVYSGDDKYEKAVFKRPNVSNKILLCVHLIKNDIRQKFF